jgi:zinc transport system substrate-binding protein
MKMIVMRSAPRAAVTGLVALAAITLAGCANSGAGGSDGKLHVVASFYPLEFIAKTVGGDAVDVTTLTAPGVEPHDLELTPKQVGSIAEAKLVLFEKDLQPAVDEAVAQNAKDAGFDVAPAAKLEETGADFESHDQGGAANPSDAVKPASFTDGSLDPHFWLDPVRYAGVVQAVTDKLVTLDAARADGYRQRATALLSDVNTRSRPLSGPT